jgi:hypothetical protein
VSIKNIAVELLSIKIKKENRQRKVTDVLNKIDHISNGISSNLSHVQSTRLMKSQRRIEQDKSCPFVYDLRSLRHHYLQSNMTREQLHILVEQGGWTRRIYDKFKHELNLIHSDHSLDLIRYILSEIAQLLKVNGSIAEANLRKHFRQHRSLFLADFEYLLTRFGLVAFDDLVDLLLVCRMVNINDIQIYGKDTRCLNVSHIQWLIIPID